MQTKNQQKLKYTFPIQCPKQGTYALPLTQKKIQIKFKQKKSHDTCKQKKHKVKCINYMILCCKLLKFTIHLKIWNV